MVEEIEDIARFYRILLVEYGSIYRQPKEGDTKLWKNLLKFCQENGLHPLLLMVSHFEFHKKRFNSTPYPNMLYSRDSIVRYVEYTGDLLARYPYREIPLRVLFKTLSVLHEVECDCHKIKIIAKELNLNKHDAAISIYNELSPYLVLMEPKLTAWLRLMKTDAVKRYYPYQKELGANKGLKPLLNEVIEREWHGRSISVRSSISDKNLSNMFEGI